MSGIVATLEPVQSADALETLWRTHERAFGATFFQSWTWLGCLFAERFTDPVLLRAHDALGGVVAFALFNRTRRWGLETLHLHETGDPRRDAVYIEHNGILIAPGAPPETLARCIAAARRAPIGGGRAWVPRRLVLSGLAGQADAAGGTIVKTHAAPYADLAACSGQGDRWLAQLRPNARQQIARARRAYEQSGPVTHTPLATIAEARAGFEELVALHQRSWIARGKPGAFATEFVRRFHAALLARGVPEGTVRIRRIASGGETFAMLYDFRDPAGVRAYQSGLAFSTRNGRALQPGLVGHATVMHQIAETGIMEYDFLGGDAQYKRMLSNRCREFKWSVVDRHF